MVRPGSGCIPLDVLQSPSELIFDCVPFPSGFSVFCHRAPWRSSNIVAGSSPWCFSCPGRMECIPTTCGLQIFVNRSKYHLSARSQLVWTACHIGLPPWLVAPPPRKPICANRAFIAKLSGLGHKVCRCRPRLRRPRWHILIALDIQVTATSTEKDTPAFR